MYKKCYATKVKDNKYKIHLWDDIGYDEILWYDTAYQIDDKGKYKGVDGTKLNKTTKWDRNTPNLYFHDMKPHQKYLVERYGTVDEPSKNHKEVQASNMSKACKTEEEAIQTVSQRSKEQGEACHYEKVNEGRYIVYRTRDRKVMKSINYFKPDLLQFFTSDELVKFI